MTIKNRPTEVCSSCGGIGLEPVPGYGYQKCPDCDSLPAEEPKCGRCGGKGVIPIHPEADIPCPDCPPTTEPASEGKYNPEIFDECGGVRLDLIKPTAPPTSIEDRAKELEEAIRQLTWDAELTEALGETDPHAKQFAANLRTVLAAIDRQKPDIERAAVDKAFALLSLECDDKMPVEQWQAVVFAMQAVKQKLAAGITEGE